MTSGNGMEPPHINADLKAEIEQSERITVMTGGSGKEPEIVKKKN